MEEIQQFLGHSDINVTRKIYARFSPSYLKDAAAALEMDDLGPVDQGALPKKRLSPLKSLPNMVGATGIEPVTPTMSRLFEWSISLEKRAKSRRDIADQNPNRPRTLRDLLLNSC
jgi:hypothetical protein